MGLEFCVALMLILLGLLNLRASFQEASTKFLGGQSAQSAFYMRLRSVVVGVVHGLAGSAAVALLLIPVIQKPVWASLYLLIFGVGTIAGMMLITGVIALPITYSAKRFQGFSRYIGAAAGALSLVLGFSLAVQIGYAGSSGLNGVAWFR